jgi:RNA polymerase sigma-70 factor (ECF subfamily)
MSWRRWLSAARHQAADVPVMPVRTAKEQSDAVLVEAALADPLSDASKEAASALLARHQDQVYAVCFYYMGDYDRALDVAQEALLSAYQNLGKFRGKAQFGSWLFSIARNRCLSELRRPARFALEELDPQQTIDPEKNPEEQLLERLDEEALIDLIREHLTEREAEVLWLRCIERMPLNTVTEVLDIRQASGARGVLQTARRKLKAVLQQE